MLFEHQYIKRIKSCFGGQGAGRGLRASKNGNLKKAILHLASGWMIINSALYRRRKRVHLRAFKRRKICYRAALRERHITVGKRSSLHNLLEAGANINNLARGELAPENTLDYLSRLADSLALARAAPQPREKPQLLYSLCFTADWNNQSCTHN